MRSLVCALAVVHVVCVQVALMSGESRYSRVVTLKQGYVRGRVVRLERNAHVAEVEVYLGIPYAAPPVGSLRFMPPGEPPHWPDMLDAARAKPVCPQMLPQASASGGRRASVERDAFVGRMRNYLRDESEDCLYLNIYVPHSQSREYGAESRKYPVIMFVHGESFEWNSGNLYDGSMVAGFGNVIFITINFRLGIFGFLKQGLTVGRANFGLSDQIAALQWTKRNIGEFGGDVGKITVMGHGTGAACVNFLMLSPVAEGLFHRAILASGSALSEWALAATSLHYIQLKDEFNCSSDDVVDCLQSKRKEDIVSAFKRYELLPFENFTPVVDEIVVLSSPAEQMEKYTLFSKYDLLAGVTEVESYFLLEEEFLKLGMSTHEGYDCLDKYAKAVFKKTPEQALMKMIEHYLGRLQDRSPIATRNAILDALSDLLVTAPLLQTVRYHASTPKNTFFYVFGHRTVSEHGIKMNRSVYGDDLPYFLGVPIDGPSFHYQSEYTPHEAQLSEATLKYFTNFAKTGNPYSSSSSEFGHNVYTMNRLSNTRWPPYNLNQQSYMYFGASTQVRHHYRQESHLFWNEEMPQSLRQSEVTTSAVEGGVNKAVDRPVSDAAGGNVVWPPGGGTVFREEVTASVPTPETTSLAATALVVAGILFLLANVIAFAYVFYQRGKLRVRENVFRNRFRCKTVSVPDLFDENDSGDIYAVAEKLRERRGDDDSKCAVRDKSKKGRRYDKTTSKKRSGGGASVGVDFEGGRVASVKPEAMSGKRMRRWPLARQCSGSTITVDAHSKVRDWIVNEVATVAAAARNATPRFSRNNAVKKRPEVAAVVDEQTDAIEMRTIERRQYRPPTTVAASSSPPKVSVAVDASRATNTTPVSGEPLVCQQQLQTLGNADERAAKSFWPAGAALAVNEDGDVSNEDSYNTVGTHKSSAHIRLKTPQFLLETSPLTGHSHSRSDPSPVGALPTTAVDQLYSRVDKGRPKLLESFADPCHWQYESESEPASLRHYEEINVTSRPDVDDAEAARVAPSAQQTLRNLVRRNFPKVLPDVAPEQQKRAHRLSLPAIGDGCERYAKLSASRSGRLAPAPPPRVTSTLGRRPAANPSDAAIAASTSVLHRLDDGDEEEDEDGRQRGRFIFQMKNDEPIFVGEKRAVDIVQTESCHPPYSPPSADGALRSARAFPATVGRENASKTPKEVRSVTTSTTGIS